MTYYDEKKHASDAYRAQIENDAHARPPEADKGRRSIVGWIVAVALVAALVIGVSLFGTEEAPNTDQPAVMLPAENSGAPDARAPVADPAQSPTSGTTENPTTAPLDE